MLYSIENETDIERLRRVALLQEAEIRHLLHRISRLSAELAKHGMNQGQLEIELKLLQEQLDRRTQALFGRSSEKRPHPPEAKEPKEKQPQTGHGPREQLALPVVEVIHDLDEPDRICGVCGGVLGELPEQFEESEEIDVIERSYRLVRHKRKKYVCRCGACVETALGPDKLIPGGRYSVDFALDVAVSKYADHMPLTRQVQIMRRQGLTVDSQTLWDQIEALARHLEPTRRALRDHILGQPVIGADETTWRLLDHRKSKSWWAWSITSPDAVVYHILDSRSQDAAKEVIGDYAGVVLADGYSAYEALRKSRAGPTFTQAHCWAHVRRKFFECLPHAPEAQEALDLIGKLYDVEREVNETCRDAEEPVRRAALQRARDERSRPIIKAFDEWCAAQRPLPKSGLGRAIAYYAELHSGLVRFLDHPDIPLDNNRTERGLRAVVVGRKNHYGSKSKRGTEVAALFYSLIESARLAGVEPKTYLKEAALRAIRNPGTATLPKDLLSKADAEAEDSSC